MNNILKYKKFCLNEGMFFMIDKFESIMKKISKTNNKEVREISNIILNNQYEDYEDLNISFFNISNNNKLVNFYDFEKAKEKGVDNLNPSQLKIGRFVRKALSVADEIDNFSDKDIEEFVNVYKSFFDFDIKNKGIFKLMSEKEGIPFCYGTHNFESRKYSQGVLGASCMNDEFDIVSFYINHVRKGRLYVLALLSPDNKLLGRSIIWNIGSNMLMDRIYCIESSDVQEFKKYARDNEWIYKYRQSYTEPMKVMSPENNYDQPINKKMEVEIGDIKKENMSDIKFPYLDTLKFFYYRSGVLSNYVNKNEYFIELIDADGGWQCDKCYGEGKIECEECDGFGIVGDEECGKCQREEYIKCPLCGGVEDDSNFY